MLSTLIATLLLSAPSAHVRLHASEPLDSPAFASWPGLGKLGAPASKKLFAPMVKRMEEVRTAEPLAGCSGVGISVNLAAALSEQLDAGKLSEKDVRAMTALGLAQAKTFTACVTKGPHGLVVEGGLTLDRVSGVLAVLTANDVPVVLTPKDHYWTVQGHLAWPDAWTAFKSFEKAMSGTRGSKLDAAIQATGTLLAVDINAALQALEGTFSVALVHDPKDKSANTVVALGARQPEAIKPLLEAMAETMPGAPFGRKKADNEWGFTGSVAGLGRLPSALFVKQEPRALTFSDTPKLLSATFRAQALADKRMAPGCLVATVDLSKYRALYERVGRKQDAQELLRSTGLDDLTDEDNAPHPKLLFQGMERATLVLRTDSAGFKFEAAIDGK